MSNSNDFIENSAGFNEGYFYDPNVKVELVKAPDSLIHIPFYIYR